MKRNKFSLSFYKLLSMKLGQLVPIGVFEVLPGDTVQHATSLLTRCAPLVAPVMHPTRIRIHHWFVPYRLLWTSSAGGRNGWEDFITGGADGLDASSFPTISFATGASAGSLADYFGIPVGTANPIVVSALPFRAYALIFNEWYRDQDLTALLPLSLVDGDDTTTNTTLQFTAWEKDYYTTSRPWAQKGPTVTIPLSGTAPIKGIGLHTTAAGAGSLTVNETGATGVAYPFAFDTSSAGGVSVRALGAGPNTQPQVFADLSAVTAADINTLRQAFALQRYEENRARYGSRYVEYLRYLGVRSSDARLQRPEFLGSGRSTLQFSEVLQTGVTTGGAVGGVGNLAGHGIAATRSNRYRRFFEEHGCVITLMSVVPRTIYANGVKRMWLRRTKTDFWQRELQHIGQQAVQNAEVYADTATPTGTFGFQDRYDEYRRQESEIAGQFRSTLNYWHMARIFGSAPTLNSSFVVSNPTNRVFADQTNDQLYVMASHSIQARRMVAKDGRSFIL